MKLGATEWELNLMWVWCVESHDYTHFIPGGLLGGRGMDVWRLLHVPPPPLTRTRFLGTGC